VTVRRWWIVSGALLAAAIVVGLSWARDVSTATARSRAQFFGAETTTLPPRCVTVSREQAVQAIGRGNLAALPPSPNGGLSAELEIGSVQAKLIRWRDWTTAPDPEHSVPSRWWLMEVEGGPFRVDGKTVSWQLVWVNARTGAVRNDSAGTGSPPSRWKELPDYSASCSSR
jgi:hypothetical protein